MKFQRHNTMVQALHYMDADNNVIVPYTVVP